MSTNRFTTYSEFFPFYLQEHSKPLTRGLHYAGTLLALETVAWAVWTQQWWMIALYPVIGYGFAWFAHFAIEKNRPATFTYPLWSFIGDHHMLLLLLSGQIKKRLLDLGILSQRPW